MINLASLKNGQNTDFKRGTIRNADALLLTLNGMGGTASRREIVGAMRAWRPRRAFGYLLQTGVVGGYGFCGTSIDAGPVEIYHHPTYHHERVTDGSIRFVRHNDQHYSTRRRYVYRAARARYAITFDGFKRLAELTSLAREAGLSL